MKVLYVVGACLTRNTSANISHNAYVQGLLENGCKVDILMARSSWGQEDSGMPVWDEATYHTYCNTSWVDRLQEWGRSLFETKVSAEHEACVDDTERDTSAPRESYCLKKHAKRLIKGTYQMFFNRQHVFHLEKVWLKRALKFKNDIGYDLIISNSSPAASHKLVMNLLTRKRISGKRWVQIWEDPWFFDLYGGHTEEERQEEHRLIKAASEVFYVSPLTLHYQKKHFSDCAEKMKYIPLPFLEIEKDGNREIGGAPRFGYFGDYYAKTRNLLPFYQALKSSQAKGYILGDSDLSLDTVENIEVGGRVTLDKLAKTQGETDILVHLCNLRGGQIPGKIYHYSATKKPILFILDGTADEIAFLRESFQKFHRYHFCENREDDIRVIIDSFAAGVEKMVEEPVDDFHPRQVVAQLIKN